MDSLNLSDTIDRAGEPQAFMDVATYNLSLRIIVSVNFLVALFAMAGNIITVLVYFRMGFEESTNVSLTGLAISDLGIVVTEIGTAISLVIPPFESIPVGRGVTLTTMAYPHIVLTRVSALITAFLSVERYLCVYLPLKIKSIFTPRRTFFVMVIIYSVAFAPLIGIYFKYPLGWKFDVETNRTIYGTIPSTDPVPQALFMIFQMVNSVVLPIATFFIVLICTILLSLRLIQSKKWRDSNRFVSSKPGGNQGAEKTAAAATETAKEARAIQMVVAVASVFIVSSIPSCIFMTLAAMVPDFDAFGRYTHTYVVASQSYFIIESLNCSANVIIYFRMSTKFRVHVNKLLGRKDS